jgi:hypothetical protein
MSDPTPMPKSEMLRRSMRCFVLGWWSLIPIIGVVPAVVALVDFRVVVAGMGQRWNAARTRLLLGAWLAGIGLLLSLILSVLLTFAILNAIEKAGSS